MFTIVLTTRPTGPALDPALVTSLRSAWGGGTAIWLSPSEAAEFRVEEIPANFRAVWGDLQKRGTDLNAVPSSGRKKALLVADLDSTMIQQECIDELAAEAGVGAEVSTITAQAMNGEIDFEGALRARVALLKGRESGLIETVLAERITLMPGARALVSTMRAEGAYAALVSGGFTAFTGRIAADLGFNEHRANTLSVEGGRLTGEPVAPILGREAKLATLKALLSDRNLAPEAALAVGDGANDLGMLKMAGLGVALHAKPVVQAECGVRINHGDLTALLYLQGYSRSEFVDRDTV